ncbi:cytochrome ubiquinol oxidase subunit I [Dolichospermum circinale CS-1225]|uniref:Cytochrome ubiquinol oxidase subunit I n=1 Tax=Dolichospermum circinale CS-537/01 TaxID=3021739 RepID=A0ABT5A435_9CYAN|nr:cytochrome ubiquinol oxidase subunit I [Dolichospermum circinale]MDB9466666.1 cytochrome ubiquinol oxidase subunit I [Dolichospermum circinale CS-539/09]MDB9469705.1 cytochrome ubiquinol oxidase subunit I [Dolichospermum circinale CS-539]MDB9476036.1 cytochrome ubiquinol oxidase subunit I [Dolichospermum circinale CS-537/11]MDB9479760.1 cytochrome ubiquinol oxidase subunit I [Dolichospermum circinale CS-537/03]MDB9486674.1 cytochrome ubiquinol oxidase subunit I [Dolichospermum circinale CS-
MEILSNTLALSRLQFAFTAIFHMIWPVLTTGMSIYLIVVEGLWLKTKNPTYYHHGRFWSKLYLLNFGIGVASGLPMGFQFGTNWAPLSEAVGDFLGSILGFEGSMAFMLEASFLGIMMFGWERVPPVIHYLATILVAFGANLSTFWILVANSWFQTPSGGEMVNGKFIVDDYFQAILNPFMVNSVLHMFLATLETSLFVIGGISAWYILNNRHQEFFSKSLKIVLAISIFVAPLQVYIGHASGDQVYHYQPTKLAAIEAQWETVPAGESAKWNLLAIPNRKAEKNDWEISIPNGLSYILELKPKLSEPVLGLKEWKPENRPPMIPLIFYSFRIMAGIGFFLVGLMLWSIIQWLRGKLNDNHINQQKWLLRSWILAAPLGYLAIESGWIVRCVGRQPWTVYEQIRTTDAASHIPASEVLFSLTVIALLYSVLFVSAMFFGSRIIRKGPDLTLPIPGSEIKTVIATESVSHIPDSRPLETLQ